MNPRLEPNVAAALRAESARTGRPQRQIIRDAITQHLGFVDSLAGSRRSVSDGTFAGLIRPARRPFGATTLPPLVLRKGETTADLLDRDDRF